MDEITPLLPPEEVYYVRQNLVMKLQIAQLAVLQEDKTVYRDSLSDSLLWIDRYFDLEHAATISMSTALKALADTPVQRAVPIETKAIQILESMSQKSTQVIPGEQP